MIFPTTNFAFATNIVFPSRKLGVGRKKAARKCRWDTIVVLSPYIWTYYLHFFFQKMTESVCFSLHNKTTFVKMFVLALERSRLLFRHKPVSSHLIQLAISHLLVFFTKITHQLLPKNKFGSKYAALISS